MKITIYELLGMVKDGKAPKKIKYDGIIWEYDGDYYVSKNNLILEEYCNLTTFLNDEVEILEEEKKIPEKLKSFNNVGNSSDIGEFKDKQQLNNHLLKDKLNEVIHYLQYLKSKGE